MRKIAYSLFLVAAMVVTFVSCADRDNNANLSQTGLIDQNGNIITNTLIITNWLTITNEIDTWVTNIVDADGNLPSIKVTNYVTNVVWETNAVVPNLPDSPTDMYKIYVPWAGKGDGYYQVNYKDTAKLKQLWLDQVQRKGVNDGKVFAIRNKANNRDENRFQLVHTHGNFKAADYYYFNSNGDIVYKEDNTVIKRFKGAVIVSYRDSVEKKFGIGGNGHGVVYYKWRDTGKYTVGAIYEMAMGIADAKPKYHWDRTGNNPFKDGVYDFIAARMWKETFNNGVVWANNLYERQYLEGFIEVLVMHPEANEGWKNSAGVHSYYAYWGKFNDTSEWNDNNVPYMTNPNIYLGQRPEYVVPLLSQTYGFTDGASTRGWCYLFMPGTPDGIGR